MLYFSSNIIDDEAVSRHLKAPKPASKPASNPAPDANVEPQCAANHQARMMYHRRKASSFGAAENVVLHVVLSMWLSAGSRNVDCVYLHPLLFGSHTPLHLFSIPCPTALDFFSSVFSSALKAMLRTHRIWRSAIPTTPLLIGGQFKQSKATSFIPVINPATQEVVTKVPICTEAEKHEAVEAAAEAFKTWSEISASNRMRMMIKYAEVIRENMTEVAQHITREQGKVCNMRPLSLYFSLCSLPRLSFNNEISFSLGTAS